MTPIAHAHSVTGQISVQVGNVKPVEVTRDEALLAMRLAVDAAETALRFAEQLRQALVDQAQILERRG